MAKHKPTILTGVDLDTSRPAFMLDYDKNCVAMTFSRVLGIGVHATINFFISKGWIVKGTDLENDQKIDVVLKKLDLAMVYKDVSWATVKTGLKGYPDGRYYAANYETRGSTPKDAKGHAFAIILKAGSVGVVGNNQEKSDKSYNQSIKDTHLISVYGPIKT